MRRLTLAAPLLIVLLVLAAAPAAQAHPLGNFTVNHVTEVRISGDRVELRYLLDQAEIPTFQERGLPRAQLIDRKRAEIARGLELQVDGRPVDLRMEPDVRLTHPPGEGGLKLTRMEVTLTAPVAEPGRVVVGDQTFADRAGWRAIVPRPGEGTEVRSSVPSEDPTDGLRSYPQGLLQSPADQRQASFVVQPGSGTVVAPALDGGGEETRGGSPDGFAAVFESAAAGQGVLVLLLLTAFGWGAFHALSPGHGKAMVAAYLVGTRGTSRDALGLGLTVTITHTIGVFALGLVTLALSQYLLPEDLYPWLTLVSGLLVVAIGAGVLRSRVRSARGHHGHGHGHGHGHDHGHDHGHGHHHHQVPDRLSRRGIIGMGAAAGLIPCPSALVVLLAALSQQAIGLGLVLILAFSVGLAATLTTLGLLVVHAHGLTHRVQPSRRVASALRTLPAVSALLIVVVGVALTAQALPQLA